MFKRIIISILTIVMSATMLTGCTFFTHNDERDMRQVIATVESYEIKNSVRDENDETKIVTYTTPKKDIYKRDLVEYVNLNSASLSQQYFDAEEMYKAAVDMLVNTELIINEVDALIDAGLIEWGLTEENAIKKRIYSAIDTSMMTIKNQILDEHGEEGISTDGDSEFSTDTTYPTKPEEEQEDDVKDTEEWQPNSSNNPYVGTDSASLSLGKEAITRFVALLKNRVKDDFRVTEEDQKLFDEDSEKIQNTIDTKGYEYVYPILGQTHYIWYISGKQIERSQKIQALQKYLTDSVTVSDEEVQKSYTDTLNSQKSSFTEDVSKFDSAMSAGSTVLFYPNDNYFYVKHILLPFSDEQKEFLTEYKKTHGKDDVEAERARMVKSIECYPHVAGEDDKTRPMTVDQVMSKVKSVMLKLESNAQAADVAFDDLIYEFNTDPGAFGNNKGYVVKYKLNTGESETYMQEFADGARYMRENLSVGQVYYEPVVTDYGVHIMYFASTTKVGEVGINSYTTPGKLQTYYELLEEPIRSARENNEYGKWENRVLTLNYKAHVELFEKRYKNLWEK